MSAPTDFADNLLTTEEMAVMFKVSPATVRDWRKKGTGPRALKIGHSVRYPMADVLAWVANQNKDDE